MGCIVQAIKACGNPGLGGVVAFFIAIDATELLTGLEIYSGYKAPIGRPYTKNFVSIEGLPSEEIEALPKGGKLASEAKTAVTSVRKTALLLSPTTQPVL